MNLARIHEDMNVGSLLLEAAYRLQSLGTP